MGFRCDLVAHIPEIFVEKVLHPLMKNLDGRTHGANHTAANDSLRQFEMMKAEEVNALVKIEKPLRNVVQTKELVMPPVNVIHAEVRLA